MLSITTLLEHISLSKTFLSTLAYEPTFFFTRLPLQNTHINRGLYISFYLNTHILFFLILLLSSQVSLSVSLSLIYHEPKEVSLLSPFNPQLSFTCQFSRSPLGLRLILSWVWVWVMDFLLMVWFWIDFFVDFGLISFDFWLIFCCCYGFWWWWLDGAMWTEFVFAYRWCWVPWERVSDESRRGEKKILKYWNRKLQQPCIFTRLL